MFRQQPQIITPLEAFDELADVQMTLSGTSTFALALVQSETSDPEAIRLLSCLLEYCALITESACKLIYAERL